MGTGRARRMPPGRRSPRELVDAVLTDDAAARQLVKDAKREACEWANAPAPDFREPARRAVYAGVVELLAERAGEQPPAWVTGVAAAPYLMGRQQMGPHTHVSPAPARGPRGGLLPPRCRPR